MPAKDRAGSGKRQEIPGGRWFPEHRIAWAHNMARVYGYVNRIHLERMFGISTPQASKDLGEAVSRGLLVYDRRGKEFALPDPFLSSERGTK